MVICALLVSTCIHIGYGSDYYDQDSPEIGCSRTQPVVCTFESDKLDNTYASRELGRAITRLSDAGLDRKSTRLNSSHVSISYAVFCSKKKTNRQWKHNEYAH